MKLLMTTVMRHLFDALATAGAASAGPIDGGIAVASRRPYDRLDTTDHTAPPRDRRRAPMDSEDLAHHVLRARRGDLGRGATRQRPHPENITAALTNPGPCRRPVLVGINGSSKSLASLRTAMELCADTGRLLIVAWIADVCSAARAAGDQPAIMALYVSEDAEVASRLRAEVSQLVADFNEPWEFIYRVGIPRTELSQISAERKVGTIVVGRTWQSRLWPTKGLSWPRKRMGEFLAVEGVDIQEVEVVRIRTAGAKYATTQIVEPS